MKPILFTVLLSLLLCCSGSQSRAAADAPPDPTGHWEGAITPPNAPAPLGIRVDLSHAADGAAQGSIDIPLQGVHGLKLTGVKFSGPTVQFAMAVRGEPQFNGTLDKDGATMAGEFSQGGNTCPFKLERKGAPVVSAPLPPPAPGIPGKGIAGSWLGTLKPNPAVDLRLRLEVTASDPNKPTGTLISIDQGNGRIPLTALTVHDAAIHFETASVGGAYEGKFNADGSEITGEWSQLGHTTPLVLRRQATAPASN